MPNSWTAADIPGQTGRRVILTGANSGIGYPAALELARHGAHVVLATRDPTRGKEAVDRIRSELPQASVEFGQLDLASLASIHDFAARELARFAPLDLLVNNAGVYAPPRRLETADGFELQFGTNVLGHFALTALLLPALSRSITHPRIVTLASIAHKRARLHFDDLQSQRTYSPQGAYQQSKLANLMLAFELDRRLRARSSPIQSIAAHPGVANTNLFHVGTFSPAEKTIRKAVGKGIALVLNSVQGGALPTLYAATAPEAQTGGYYGPQGFFETRGGDVGPAKVAPQARNQPDATRLWQACEDLTQTHML